MQEIIHILCNQFFKKSLHKCHIKDIIKAFFKTGHNHKHYYQGYYKLHYCMILRAMVSVLRKLLYSKRLSCPQLTEASFSKFFGHSSAIESSLLIYLQMLFLFGRDLDSHQIESQLK